MSPWLIIVLLIVGVLAGYFAGEFFRPKVVEVKRDTTFLTRTIEIPIEKIVIKRVPAKIFYDTVEVHDTIALESYASLDTTLLNNENYLDTLKIKYYLPPVNEWRDISLAFAPRYPIIQEKVVMVEKTIEKSQFLSGYPEKLLYFLGGYGVAKLVSK